MMKVSAGQLTKSTKGLVMRKSVLIAAVATAAVALSGVRIYADDASDIEQYYSVGSYVSYDNTSGLDANGYPVITAVASQPGTFGGHLYTGWSVLAQDQTGSLDLFVSQFTLTNMTHNASSMAVGDGVNVAGQWGPFDMIPELSFSTVPSSNNYFNVTSHGNALPTPPVFTTAQIVATGGNLIPGALSVAGYYLEIQNVTISGSTGSFQSTFPTYAQANTVNETYTISDGGASITMFDWTTSYSVCGAMGGSAVPTGPVDIYGFVDAFSGNPEFVPLSIVVPEPSTIMLAGLGLAGLLAIRRRRS